MERGCNAPKLAAPDSCRLRLPPSVLTAVVVHIAEPGLKRSSPAQTCYHLLPPFFLVDAAMLDIAVRFAPMLAAEGLSDGAVQFSSSMEGVLLQARGWLPGPL